MSSQFNLSKRLSNGFGSSYTNGSSEDSQTSFYNGGQTNGASRHLQRQSVNLDELRAGLARRNTTSNQASTFGFPSFSQQPRTAAGRPTSGQFSFPTRNEPSQALDRKQQEYELIRQKQARFKAEMEALARQEEELRRDLYASSQQSEPTTPPDYQESNGFPTALSRPNRFSSSSIISPPSYTTRSSRAGSQVTSPPNERDRALQALTGYPDQSMPSSRGDSDEEERDSYDGEVLNFDHKKAATLNRNSMPVTRRDLGTRNGISSNTPLGHLDPTSFLFDDDETKISDQSTPLAKNFPSSYLMSSTQDNFPTLRPIGHQTKSSTALDLANSQVEEAEVNPGGWPTFNRQSLPLLSNYTPQEPTANTLPVPNTSGNTTPSKSSSLNRHSTGARLAPVTDAKRPSLFTSPPSASSTTKSTSSFSTSAVPTMATVNSVNGTPAKPATTAEQRLHQHNLSLGRIPASAVNSNRQSRDFSPDSSRGEEQGGQMASLSSMMQANLTPLGGTSTVLSSPQSQTSSVSQNMNAFNSNNQVQSNGYSISSPQSLSAMMGSVQLQSPPQYNAVQSYAQPYGYNPFQQMPVQRLPDNQTRVMQQRRNQSGDDAARFGNVELSQLQGEIYGLCKDQHGCRYLQKKLEEHKPENVEMIFQEVYRHMIELMIDPFGNYLCQKLLEHADEDQRTTLIEYASPNMVDIALNQHGTRALQKMIEFVSTPKQIEIVTHALKDHVVPMIQDLNGNHVIQKCLNRLSSPNIQFVVDAVAANCVTVGTHRHGCCVIQRCVDHADGQQKAQLVASITTSSMDLVQDPFGNYVLQYIFDLDQKSFSQPLCEAFLGAIPRLSKQKFSSNVIEKCLRVADADTKHAMIQEIINAPNFTAIVDDNYANYVVQTAIEQGTPEDETLLVERIRPMLANIRHKPHGRRYVTRINERDRRLGITDSGTITPSDISSPESTTYSTPYNRNMGQETQQAYTGNLNGGYSNFTSPMYQYSAASQYPSAAQYTNGAQYPNNGQYQNVGFGYGMAQSVRGSTAPMANFNQYQQGNVQHNYTPFGRAQQNGGSFFY